MQTIYDIRCRIFSAKLPPLVRLIGIAIASHINHKSRLCNPGQKRIAAMCNVSVPTVKRAIAKLKKHGILQTVKQQKSSLYVFSEVLENSLEITLDDPSEGSSICELSEDKRGQFTMYTGPFKEGIGEGLGEYDER
jgi:DNA-binding transcriptional MocR family regulator